MSERKILDELYNYVMEKRAAHGKHSGTEREQGNWDMASCIEGKILMMAGALRDEADEAIQHLEQTKAANNADRWGDVMDIPLASHRG